MDPTTHISLREEAPSGEARLALRRALTNDPVLLEQTRLWASVCERTAETVTSSLPPTGDLIAVALFEAELLGDADVAELSRVRDVQKALEPVRRHHPSVNALLSRIAADARAFQDMWPEDAQARARTRALRTPAPPTPAAPGRLRRAGRPALMWTAAASVVLLVVAALFLLRAPDTLRIAVPEGATRTVQLADGSTVLLAGPADLSWQESSTRRVFLTGKGFFDVVAHSDPFDVTTEHAVTTVSGTEFGVESGNAGTHVTVLSGRVHVRPLGTGTDVLLVAGEAARVTPTAVNAPDITPAGLDPLMWTGLFIFRDTPIDSVAVALESAYNVDIDVQDSLRDETLTGTFDRDQPVGEILTIVAAALGADLELPDRQPVYRLVRRESAAG